MTTPTVQQTVQDAHKAYEAGEYEEATQAFAAAVKLYQEGGDALMAAEMANNQSVCALKAGDAPAAWEAARDTDRVFAEAGDVRRQGMALSNQAAAKEALGSLKEAEELYTQSVDLLKQAGETEMRSMALKSLSSLQVRRGEHLQAMATMQTALTGKKKLSLQERFLQKLLKVPFRMLNR